IATVFHLQNNDGPAFGSAADKGTFPEKEIKPTPNDHQSPPDSDVLKSLHQNTSLHKIIPDTAIFEQSSSTSLSSSQASSIANQGTETITVDSVLGSTSIVTQQPTKAAALQPEVSSYHLMDINTELRQRLAELKEERDWLRKRLEKMEMRSERDQMLLLSENDHVRRLLPQSVSTGQRLLSAAFPWLGFQKSNSGENQSN
ncbi:MAG: hypothetical protein PHC51_13010, partial [bacterium]|nr:hypothetical protein [bacterium]